MRKVLLELGQSIRNLGDRAASDPDSIFLDVQQSPYPVKFGLNDPRVKVCLDILSFALVEILPGAQQHRLNLRWQGLVRMLLPPVVVTKTRDVRLLARTAAGRDLDPQSVTRFLKFGQGFHATRPRQGSSRATRSPRPASYPSHAGPTVWR